MANLSVYITNAGVPAPGLADDPEITVRRADTGSVVVTSQAMTDIGAGHYSYTYAPGDTNPYAFFVDADPNVTGQVTSSERYYAGAFDEVLEGVIEDVQSTVDATQVTVNAISTDLAALVLGEGSLLAISNEIRRRVAKIRTNRLGNIRRR